MNIFDTVADESLVQNATAGLAERGFTPHVAATGAEALELIKTLIPAGASVYNGSSKTLDQVGYIEYLKGGTHGWNNLQAGILAETDPAKQSKMRKEASMADYYLGSVHALSASGELVIASASGSQMPAIVFNADNLIFVVSTKKITESLDAALARLKEHVFPLEDARMKSTGAPGSVLSKILIYERHPGWGRNIHVILVKEDLGF